MKKRLLSAALALVMVLTMLPLSAFADPDPAPVADQVEEVGTPGGENQDNETLGTPSKKNEPATVADDEGGGEGGGDGEKKDEEIKGQPKPEEPTKPTLTGEVEIKAPTKANQQVQYYDYGRLDNGQNIPSPGYYWSETVNGKTTYYQVKTGVVGSASSNANSTNPTTSSGIWYSTLTEALTKGSSATLIQDATLASLNEENKNYVIDLNGNQLTISDGAIGGRVSSLTITDNQYIRNSALSTAPLHGQGTIAGNISRVGDPTTGSNSALTVNLNGVSMSGGIITLNDYARHTVNLTNGTVVGAITLNGHDSAKTTDQGQTLTVGSKTVNRPCTVGDMKITGDGSQVNIYSMVASGSAPKLELTGQSTQLNMESGALGAVTIEGISKTWDKRESTAPKITISGGTVASLEQTADDKLTKELDITINSLGTVSGKVEIKQAAKIVVNQGTIGGNVTLPTGSLTVKGPYASVAAGSGGEIKLNKENKTTLTVTGKNNTLGKISAEKGNGSTLTISIPNDRSNHFGALDLNDYIGRGIEGGVFKTFTNKDAENNEALWFHPDVSYVLIGGRGGTYDVAASGEFAYYAHKELAQAVADAKGANWSDTPLRIAGQAVGGGSYTSYGIGFFNGDTMWAKISYRDQTGVYLPENIMGINSLDGGVDNWINLDTGTSYKSGLTFTTPVNPATGKVGDVKLGTQVAANAISKLTSVNLESVGQGNENVRAVLNGNQIVLSGAVTADKGGPWAKFVLTMNTNIVNSNINGKDQPNENINWEGEGEQYYKDSPYVVISRSVTYNVTTKEVQFDDLTTGLPSGVTMPNLTTLRLSNGTEYTLSASGLQKRADNFKTDDDLTGQTIEVSVNIPGLTNTTTIQKIKDDISGEGSVFYWAKSPAIRQAINAAEMGLNDNTIKNWLDQTQSAAWRSVYQTTPNDKNKAATGYNEVWLVPFLKMNVTAYHEATGSLTATLVPSYRVEVRQSDPKNAATAAYRLAFDKTNGVNIVQPERTLGELTGAVAHSPKTPTVTGDAGVVIRFSINMPAAFKDKVMHQDTTYAYKADTGTVSWTLTHAGKTGLGAILIDSTEPAITLYDQEGSDKKVLGYYDSLQAAIDNTTENVKADGTDVDYIVIGPSYTLKETVSVTGDARKIKINSAGNTELSINSSGGTVDWSKNGNVYTVQLLRSNTAATASGIPITVTPVTGGTASVSPNNGVKVGDTITITLNPAVSYVAAGVTVRTSEGASVTVSGSGTRYTFVVPTGAKGITVTPSFNRTNVSTSAGATVSVSNSPSGSAITSAGSNRVAGGSTVTVNTTPAAGQRTMGVYVSSDYGATTAIRTGLNSFSFTVPANATNVVVTPRFDANNGTVFEDVWSTEYYSAPVAWAVSQGVTTGTSTYTFGSNNVCTRADMVTFLWRAAGKPAVTNVRNPFSDVEAGMYYYDAVLWAASKGITNGVETNRFGVNEYVTRAQAVTFLHRYEGTPGASNYSSFYDVPASEYYARAVSWANSKGVTKGTTNTLFSPNSYCKRCEVVTFLYRDVTGNIA